jgi:hypothetical protein
MYRNDKRTGETEFALDAVNSAREVVLEGFSGNARLRIPMHRVARRWVARIALGPGWFFYRFCIDGRTRQDRPGAKLRTADGQSWSVALIVSGKPASPASA